MLGAFVGAAVGLGLIDIGMECPPATGELTAGPEECQCWGMLPIQSLDSKLPSMLSNILPRFIPLKAALRDVRLIDLCSIEWKGGET